MIIIILLCFSFFLKKCKNSYFFFRNFNSGVESIVSKTYVFESRQSRNQFNEQNVRIRRRNETQVIHFFFFFFIFISLSFERKTIFHYKHHRYSQKAVDACHELFNYLPLAHCINGKVLVVHGGLFDQDGVTLDDIRKTNRFRQVCIYIYFSLKKI